MKFTVKQIAELLGGTIEGNPEVVVSTLCKIEEGCEEGLSFLSNPKYIPHIYTTTATAVIVSNEFVPEHVITTTLIRVENPYSSFAKLLEVYDQIQQPEPGISPLAYVDAEAKCGKEVYIAPFAVIEKGAVIADRVRIYPHVYVGKQVVVGEGTTLFSGVKLYANSIVGKSCILHAGAVIGSDGFGYAPQPDGVLKKIPQIGNVVIEDDVEIGANTTIDKATMGSTFIRKGAKIDNLCQVAHNCSVGESTGMAAQVGMAGSSKIGNNCMIGGQVGFSGHISIGNQVQIGAQAGVISNIPDGSAIQGSPAFSARGFLRSSVCFQQLPNWGKTIHDLEKRIAELEAKISKEKN